MGIPSHAALAALTALTLLGLSACAHPSAMDRPATPWGEVTTAARDLQLREDLDGDGKPDVMSIDVVTGDIDGDGVPEQIWADETLLHVGDMTAPHHLSRPEWVSPAPTIAVMDFDTSDHRREIVLTNHFEIFRGRTVAFLDAGVLRVLPHVVGQDLAVNGDGTATETIVNCGLTVVTTYRLTPSELTQIGEKTTGTRSEAGCM